MPYDNRTMNLKALYQLLKYPSLNGESHILCDGFSGPTEAKEIKEQHPMCT